MPTPTPPPATFDIAKGDTVVTAPKNPLTSVTLLGIVTTLASMAANRYLPADLRGPVVDFVLECFQWVVGPGLAMLGRYRATRPLGFGNVVEKTVT